MAKIYDRRQTSKALYNGNKHSCSWFLKAGIWKGGLWGWDGLTATLRKWDSLTLVWPNVRRFLVTFASKLQMSLIAEVCICWRVENSYNLRKTIFVSDFKLIKRNVIQKTPYLTKSCELLCGFGLEEKLFDCSSTWWSCLKDG